MIFPRGYLWSALIWFSGAAAGVWLGGRRFPLWIRADGAAGLLLATIIFVVVASTLTFRAFSADRVGVRIGLPSSSKRRGRSRRAAKHVPWQQIERIRIAKRLYGVRLELILGPNATLAVRGYKLGPAVMFVNRVLLLLIPFWYLVWPSGLITPLEGPPRFRVALRGVTVEEMRRAMRSLAPPEVAIAVLVRRGQSVSSARAAGQQA